MVRKRNFFRYTYTPRVLMIGAASWVVKACAIYWAYRLQWALMMWVLTIAYGIFFALFLLISYRKWLRYKNWGHGV